MWALSALRAQQFQAVGLLAAVLPVSSVRGHSVSADVVDADPVVQLYRGRRRELMAQKPIRIKKSARGSFTAAAKKAGKSVQQEAADVLKPGSKASPALRKKANLARNAAKWKKG